MANIISSVGRFFNAANEKADQLTSIAKGALCIPSIVAGLPDMGKSLVTNLAANATSILSQATSLVSSLVIGSIGSAVNRITGSVTGLLNTVTGLVASVAGVVKQTKEFAEGLRDRVTDVKDFSADKENCNFAAASLLNCITAEALSNVTAKGAVDIAKGASTIDSFANNISNNITSASGAINRTINKSVQEVNRAERMISKSDLF